MLFVLIPFKPVDSCQISGESIIHNDNHRPAKLINRSLQQAAFYFAHRHLPKCEHTSGQRDKPPHCSAVSRHEPGLPSWLELHQLPKSFELKLVFRAGRKARAPLKTWGVTKHNTTQCTAEERGTGNVTWTACSMYCNQATGMLLFTNSCWHMVVGVE